VTWVAERRSNFVAGLPSPLSRAYMPRMSVFRKLITPACAVAALSISSTAFAGQDPSKASPDASVEAEASVEADAPEADAPEADALEADAPEADAPASADASADASAPVGASVPVTITHEVAAGEESVATTNKIVHGGSLAVGASRTMAGLTGVVVRYYLNDHMHLGVNLGVATFSYRYPDLINDAVDCSTDPAGSSCTKKTRTVAYIGSSLEFIYWVLGKPVGNGFFQADFGVGGRVGFQHYVNSTDIPDDLDDPLQFTAEIPLMLQLNIGPNFAIVPEFGAAFRWNPGNRIGDPAAADPIPPDSNPGFDDPNGRIPAGETSGPGFGFEINDHIGLFGGASLLYHF
jgi:hypothetical protein